MYSNCDHLEFSCESCPIGLAEPLIELGLYRAFLANGPQQDRMCSFYIPTRQRNRTGSFSGCFS